MAKEILTFTFSTQVYTQFIKLFRFIQFKKANRILSQIQLHIN